MASDRLAVSDQGGDRDRFGVPDQFGRLEQDAAGLGPEDIRRVAAGYRQSRDLLADTLGSVDPDAVAALAPLNERLRDTIAARAGGEVGSIDIEDAVMAAWFALLAATDPDQRPVADLLAGPWRRAVRAVTAQTSRTQADRVTFSRGA